MREMGYEMCTPDCMPQVRLHRNTTARDSKDQTEDLLIQCRANLETTESGGATSPAKLEDR